MEREEEPDLATREEWAAAAEAAAIGGRHPDLGDDDEIDEAKRPVYEAGGGEQEGFELAEHDLVRNATHDDGTGYPERDAFTPSVSQTAPRPSTASPTPSARTSATMTARPVGLPAAG